MVDGFKKSGLQLLFQKLAAEKTRFCHATVVLDATGCNA